MARTRVLSSEPGKVLGGTIASVLGIILVTFLIWEIANSLIENSLTKKDASGTDLEASARTRTLLTVTIDDAAKADHIFYTLMGGEVPPRKAFIQAHAKSVTNLDI